MGTTWNELQAEFHEGFLGYFAGRKTVLRGDDIPTGTIFRVQVEPIGERRSETVENSSDWTCHGLLNMVRRDHMKPLPKRVTYSDNPCKNR